MTDVTSGYIHDPTVGSAASSRQVHIPTEEEKRAMARALQEYAAEQNASPDMDRLRA